MFLLETTDRPVVAFGSHRWFLGLFFLLSSTDPAVDLMRHKLNHFPTKKNIKKPKKKQQRHGNGDRTPEFRNPLLTAAE